VCCVASEVPSGSGRGWAKIWARLSAVKSPAQMAEEPSRLHRVLGPVQLTMLGVGGIIGTGIFVLTGRAAAGDGEFLGAGPALVLSFLFTALACGLAALCYAEFASMIPLSGSAYTYAYASFGELVAWIIGWDLVLEYAVGNVAIAIGWSGYFNAVLQHYGIHFPPWLSIDPMTLRAILASPANYTPELVEQARLALATAPNLGMPLTINLPAVIVVILISLLLYIGIRESARFNSAMVFVKIGMVCLFLIVGLPHVDFQQHWQSFAPNGVKGIMQGAALIFFAYIGFDAISTTAEEARNPQRDMPIGMLASLAICTLLYIAVATVLTGMVPLHVLRSEKPVADALTSVGANTVATIISLGAILSMGGVLVVMQLAQTRIFFAMSRDGLLPAPMSRVHPRFRTPHVCTAITGLLVAIPAGLVDIGIAADISNIGTLFAFILVAAGILVLRVREPGTARGFRTPLVWLVAPGCIVTCTMLTLSINTATWIRFGIWMAVGLVIYFAYGYHRSVLGRSTASA
jgi:basic amino acid/polyamine antiporter, APA family